MHLRQDVFTVNLNTLEVSHFHSQTEAGRVLGVSRTHINDVIKGRLNKTNGYWFVNADKNANAAIENKLHDIKEKYLETK